VSERTSERASKQASKQARVNFVGLGLRGKLYEKDHKETEFEGVDWIHLAEDRDKWRALANTVMNLRVP
jgi:hypothetical protein